MENKKRFGVWSLESGVTNPHSALHIPHSKGFTLIEIVITIVIIGILAGVAAMIIMQGVRAYSDEQSRSDVHYQARIAVERMARELRMIRQASEFGTANYPAVPVLGTVITPTATSLSFKDMTDTTVTYSFDNGTQKLNRSVGGPPVLAQGVTAFSFTIYDNADPPNVLPAGSSATGWVIQIDVTSTQGTESLQIRTRVHPMNF